MATSTASEIECPKCGTVAVNRDFCSCGEYVGWELTTTQPEPAPETPAYRPPAPPLPRAATQVTLRDPARQDDPGAAVSVAVVPGEEVTVVATVRNQGEIVDTFDVRVDGLPGAWWTASPGTVFLNPWGSSGDYEREVHVRLHPPRTPASEARAWPLTVVVRSRSLDADVAWVQATLAVRPFQSTVMYAGPERRRGRRHASFDVAVGNHGNSPVEVVVAAADSETRCPITVTPARSSVAVGQAAAAVVRVGVPRPIVFGRPVDHHVDVTHRVTGLESEPVAQRVTFRQRPWLPWWIPLAVALVAAFAAALLLLRREPEVPKLAGETVEDALVVLDKHGLKLGRTRYETAPKGVTLHTILRQEPAAGDEIVEGQRINVTLAAPPTTASVPPVNGLTLGEAAEALTAAKFGYSPQPASAGNDWVVIRQDPTPGTKLEVGTQVTLAVEDPTPASATPAAAPALTPSPTATPTATATAKPEGASSPTAKAKPAAAKRTTAKTATVAATLPADFVFAGATSGQLFRWASTDAKPERLTASAHPLETPTKTDEGYVAVQVAGDARRLVRVSADGKTVERLADGDHHRPAYSQHRGLLAVIAADGQRGPADAGALCALDPQDTSTSACLPADGRRLGRPSWSPNGRSVLVLAAGSGGDYDEVLSVSADGGDPLQWTVPASGHSWASVESAVWVGNDRIAVLAADRPGERAHLRLLARRANGGFAPIKEFPALTGFELAATKQQLALRRGRRAGGDGPIVLLDVDRARPRIRSLTTGSNPAWGH